MSTLRKTFKVNLLTEIFQRAEKEAVRRKWDVDLVVEEALVVFFEGDKASRKKGE